MAITGLNNQFGTYSNNSYQGTAKSISPFKGIMANALEKAEKLEGGKTIGFGTIIDRDSNCGWCMIAKYAADSTPENPIIYVETNYGGKTSTYNIEINQIDPQNASRLEMFALASYADDRGIGCQSTFGTYNTLNNLEEMAIHNGYFGADAKGTSTWEQFEKAKLDWEKACRRLVGLFYDCKDLRQYQYGKDILDLFVKFPGTE